MPALLDAPAPSSAAPGSAAPGSALGAEDDHHVTVPSALLGPLLVGERDRYAFPQGVYGFPAAHDFALVASGRPGLFWLQSTVEPGLAFLVADPFATFPDYAPEVPDAELVALGDGLPPAPEQLGVFAVVTLGEGGAATANLRAPLVLDVHARRGRQVVLPGERRGVAEPFRLH